MQLRPTIGTVATQARVSIKTVSRVINNSSSVKPATRDHVMSVIRQLGFSPSPTARTLAGHRSLLIGLPFDSSAPRYVTEVRMGSLRTLSAENYQIVNQACDSTAADVADEVQLFVQRVRVDGVILTPPLSSMQSVRDVLDAQGVPFVTIASERTADTARSVFTVDRSASAALTRYLAELGHKRIGYLGSRLSCDACDACEQRYRGYCDGLDRGGIALDRSLVMEGSGSFESGIECARELLRLRTLRGLTAIVAANDRMAAGALAVAHEQGIAVPQRLSIAGFDDDPIASQVWPRLTTIRQPIQALAEQAAGLLLRALRRKVEGRARRPLWPRPVPDELLIESALIVRESTGPAPEPQRT